MNCYNQKESGKRIKNLRKLHGFTQEALAEKLHVSPSHIGKIETGSNGISIDFLIEVAELFHVSLDYLILGKEPTNELLRHKTQEMIAFLTEMERSL